MRLFLRHLLIALLMSTPLWVHAADWVSVARPEINMRTGPGTQHDPVWRIGRGYPLQVTGRQGDWLSVRDFESDTGWVYRPLVNSVRHFIVRASVANIRSAPRTSSRIVGKAKYGDVLKTLERRKQWVKVRHESGRSGWIARRLLWGW